MSPEEGLFSFAESQAEIGLMRSIWDGYALNGYRNMK
jgi:hypothetical protein